MMSRVAQEEATLDRVREIVNMALNVEQALKVTCPDCGSQFVAKVPDVSKLLSNVTEVLVQIEGRAGEAAPGDNYFIIERPTP